MNRRQTLLALAAAGAALWLGPHRASAQMALGDMALGDPDAPVEVIEYASFTCSHCASFYDRVKPQLQADYIDTGKVRFIHREVYFDKYGLWAGLVARCGGPDRYFGIVDMIYDRQRDWMGAGDAAAVAEALTQIGVAAGLERAALDVCLQDRDAALALVEAFQTQVDADAVDSTPTLIVNGARHSNMRYGDLAALIDAELGE
jgi:protein-disulfide isomerase